MNAARKLVLTSAAVAVAAGGLLVGGATPAVATDAVVDPVVTESPDVAPLDEDAAPEVLTVDTEYDEASPKSVAAAYGNLSVSPAGPYSGGESVTIKGGGFEPNEQVVLSICIGGQRLAGPQDCAPLNGSSSAVGAANGGGVASLSVKVIKGDLGAQSKPGHVCGNAASESCVFSLTNFGGKGPDAVRVTYKETAAAGGGTPAADTGTKSKAKSKKKNKSGAAADPVEETTSGSDDEAADTGAAAAEGDDTASGGAQIAATGAGPATTSAAFGAALLALGVALTLVGRRRTPVGFARR